MTQQEKSQGIDTLKGVSLSSLLQVLEQESKSCKLMVRGGGQEGCFFFDDGILVDAQCEDQLGVDAAYTMLLWDDPAFVMAESEDRMRRIHLPLAQVILTSAKQKDEDYSGEAEGGSPVDDGESLSFNVEHLDPAIQTLIQSISSIAGVQHLFILNRQGQMITQSSKKMRIGDFLAYSIVSGIQMGKILNVKGPSRIQFMLGSGETLLIVPKAGAIICLLVDEHTAVEGILDDLGGIATV